MRGTREFYELQSQFEKTIQKVLTCGHRMDRENGPNTPKNVFYQDGYVNEMFHAYMMGYQCGKTSERLGLYD